MRRVLLILIFLLIPVSFAAQSGQIQVLTVGQGGAGVGGVGDVYLEVRPGNGLTFIDSFPLTREDTQISTRFARQYACALADIDCSGLDFFYVIRASGSLVQGPSAGAAMTVLTYATLEGLPIAENTVMTGTINSGGLIGPVGGTTEKISAARAHGFTRVLVPAIQHNKSMVYDGIDVVPVRDIEEALWYFTGEDVRPDSVPIVAPPEYEQNMELVMNALCDRAELLMGSVENVSNSTTRWLSLAAEAGGTGRYYAAASYCFSANLDLRRASLAEKSQGELRRIYRQLEKDIEIADQSLPDELMTISDLEVYMIVRERLIDAYDSLEALEYENISSSGLGYALERYNSAITWSSFFGKIPSAELLISDERLQESCLTKLAQAEERINYLYYATGVKLEESEQQLQNAYEDERQEEWALCTFKAGKAKAEADSVLSAMYGGQINDSVQEKLAKARDVLGAQAARGNFPILAYSYLEYAEDLDDPYSSSLYAEYALELSSLEIFFSDRHPRQLYDYTRILLLFSGFFVGVAAGVLVAELAHRRKPKKKRKKR